jgi:CHAT domain-containing protein
MSSRLQADLVVISACQTGIAGILGGDEFAGLAQAFLQAGARSLIVSLWSVDDSSTASFMKAFYSAYHGGVDKAQALSQAVAHVREQADWQHSFYWGAFVLMGDWQNERYQLHQGEE